MKKVMLFIVSAVFSVSANAASFNFAAIADAAPGEYGAPSIVFVDGSVTVTATSTGANAYLDAGNAGLGSCAVLSGSAQCLPGNDDNIEKGENVILTFNDAVGLDSFDFTNGDHQNVWTKDATFSLIIDGVFAFTNAFVGGIGGDGLFNGLWTGTVFEFVNTSADNDDVQQQFYIANVSAVPVPAALFLFAPALLGFFGLRRKATLAA